LNPAKFYQHPIVMRLYVSMINNSHHLLPVEMESDTYFRSIFDNALYGIATTIGTDFRFASVNDAFCRLLEYDREELVGVRSVGDITVQDDYPQNEQLLTSMIDNEIQRFQIEKQYVAKSGRCIDVIVYVLGFYDNDGKYIGSTGSIMDITATKKLFNKLEEGKKDLQQLAGRLLSVQEEERRRLARELHDDLAQRLALLVIEAGMAQSTGDTGESATILQNVQDKLITISEDVHRISRQLHPSIIEDLGLEDALRSEINNFSRLEEIPVKLEYDLGSANPSLDIAVCLYRVTQESLRNIKKHACAKIVIIQLLRENSSVLLTIYDDGRGFIPDKVRNMPGLGLKSMRERMRLINGTISYNSKEDQGTTVKAKVDMPL
jgi:PAS domain S-box-containing protein